MKFNEIPAPRSAGVSLTSMLDVIFLLLCFFVTASVFSQWESEIAIQLPSAATADEQERLPGEIIANIARDGSVTVNGAALPLDELTARLRKIAEFYPGQAVILRADCNATYEKVVAVVDACRSAGVWNFSLATVEAQSAK